MAERAPRTPEQSKDHEAAHESAKDREKLQETVEAGKQAKHEAQDSLEAIRSSIEKEAEKTDALKKAEKKVEEPDKGPTPVVIDRAVKNKAYKKELHRVQSHLPKSQRSFSKFIHAPSVETASEVGGKTVARPSGLLGGGIAAFVGSALLVWTSRHYGFTYNFFVFIALLIAGFVVGLVIEMIVRGLTRSHHS